jgi:DNA modification methylase
MPILNWASKTEPAPVPAALALDSITFPGGAGYPQATPQNQLILGDNLAVMSALLPEYEGRIQLIYADPPFFTNRRYPARVGQGEDSRRPWEWQLAEGYADHWTDLEAYLDMLYPRLALMHRLLAPTGSLYLHLDWHANAYARLLLDEIFSQERLLNEIIWVYHGPSPIRSAFNRKHDTILLYTKSEKYTFNVDAVRTPYDPQTVKTFESSSKAGFGKVPDLERGKVPEDWWYFPVVARMHSERTGYPTQKPQALLERMLLASSNPRDLVADFFSGSGTAAIVAAHTGRRFIVSDASRRALQTSRMRLVNTGSEPFDVKQVVSPGHDTSSDSKEEIANDAASQVCALTRAETGEWKITLDQSMLASLDYWEVDPAWDGSIFRSAVQKSRPRRRGQVSGEIKLPAEWVGDQIRVRLIEVSGRQMECSLQTSNR